MIRITFEANVSVPIRGLFNLTGVTTSNKTYSYWYQVSVPIRGLFNLTCLTTSIITLLSVVSFPSPSGDYLI